MLFGPGSTTISEVVCSQCFRGWRVPEVAGDSHGQYVHRQPNNLAESITLIGIFQLTDNGVAARAQQPSNQSRIVVMVHGQTTALYRFRLLAAVTNAALIRKDGVVLLDRQPIIVQQPFGAGAFFCQLFHEGGAGGVSIFRDSRTPRMENAH
jgi:hypothetical protein